MQGSLPAQNFNTHFRKGMTSFTEFKWDTLRSIWKPLDKIDFTSNKSIFTESLFAWDRKQKKWSLQSKSEYKLLQDSLISEKTISTKKAKSKNLVPVQKTSYNYANGKKISEEKFDIKIKDKTLKNAITKFVYDTAGALEATVTSIYKNKTFIECGEEERTYNSIRKISAISRTNNCSQEKKSNEKYIYEYNEDSSVSKLTVYKDEKTFSCNKYKYKNKLLVKNHHQLWDKKDSIWNDVYIELYSYNENEQIIEKLQQIKRKQNSSWVNSRRTLYCYNSEGRLISEKEQKFLQKQEVWILVFKRDYAW